MITILSDIEKAIVLELKKMISENADILPLNGNIDTQHSAKDYADYPSLNISILVGEISHPAFDLYRAEINIDILAVATSSVEQDKRINELYPILTAAIFRLAGLTLRSEDGKKLPIAELSCGSKFGQISEDDENQLAYKAVFQTSFYFGKYNEPDMQKIKGLILDYYILPFNETDKPDASDVINAGNMQGL